MRELFSLRGFKPYLIAMFLNAFVDLGHKIVIQNTVFKTFEGSSQSALIALVNALILLPFILMFTPASFIANRYRKVSVMRVAAWFAVAITMLLTLCYAQGWFWAAFALTIILAVQSAFFSPAKYGYIREACGDTQLAAGNGVVQALTTVAILGGMLGFSIWYELRYAALTATQTPSLILAGMVPLGAGLIALSLLEVAAAYAIPLGAQAGDPSARFQPRHYLQGGYLRGNLRTVRRSRIIWLAIVGLAVYWGLAQSLIAVFPAYVQERLGLNNTALIQAMLAATGLGVMAGSLLAGRGSRRHIETGFIPVGAVGLALGIAVLTTMQAVWALTLLMFAIGVAGGLFIVPLNALIQHQARPEQLGTVLAGNNWIQNLCMLGFLLFTAASSWAGLHAAWGFGLLAAVAAGGALYTVSQLPHSFVRLLFTLLFQRAYRVNVTGFEHIPRQGGVLLLGNHISWIDWAIVQIACPRPIRFVIQRDFYQLWYLKPFLRAFGAIPIATGQSRSALTQVQRQLEAGEVVCLFPEGAISRNGQLGQFHAGYQRAVRGVSNAVIVPFFLQGLWGSRLSRASDKLLQNRKKSGMKRNLLVCFGHPLPLTTPPHALKQQVFELSIGAWREQTDWLQPIAKTWLHTARKRLSQFSLIDSSGRKYRNRELIATVLGWQAALRKQTANSPRIGVLLPTSSDGIIASLSVLLTGKTLVTLNDTLSPTAFHRCLETTGVHHLITSRAFAKKLQQRGKSLDDYCAGASLLYTEDLQRHVGFRQHAASLLPSGLIYALFGRPQHFGQQAIEQAAAILFSSGSEGEPKGIVLSHRNIVANCLQVSDVLNITEQDMVMACLPLFHCYGLTMTCLLPLLEGIPVVCHPDSADATNIAKAVARYKATLICTTPSMIRQLTLAPKAHPLMLASLRMVVSGATKLQRDERQRFQEKFGKIIYESYGATETTPMVAINTPDYLDDHFWHLQVGNRPGSVGLPVPGTAVRIVAPDTLHTLPTGVDGLILIGGSQIMLGYLEQPERTAEAIVELDGQRWYKTGDKGHLDEDGFLYITDRYARFATINDEPISLTDCEIAVRQALTQAGLDIEQAEWLAIKLAHPKGGDQIVMLHTAGLEENTLAECCRDRIPAPLQPAHWLALDAIPKLSLDKPDTATAMLLAAEYL